LNPGYKDGLYVLMQFGMAGAQKSNWSLGGPEHGRVVNRLLSKGKKKEAVR